MDSTKIIKDILKDMNEDYDVLKPYVQTRLHKIEDEIQRRKAIQDEAIKTLQTMDFSIKAISSEIGESRTSMYNNAGLPKRYLEQSAQYASSANPYNTIEKLQYDKSLMQEQITKLMDRDLDMELMKAQNRELSSALEGKNAEIERLQARLSEVTSENLKLKTDAKTVKSPSTTRNIKAFPMS